MSPEQAQGGQVDHCTDLWALGCVLYEMIAGQRPFKGQYDQVLLYEIVNEEPEPLTAIRAGLPMELEFIVGKCLAKDSVDRYDSASELAKDLRSLGDKLKSGRSTILHTAAQATEQQVQASEVVSHGRAEIPSWQRRLPWAVAVIATLTALVFGFLRNGPQEREPLSTLFELSDPDNAGIIGVSVSPDGKTLAYRSLADVSRLWLRPLDGEATKAVDGYPRQVGWSPDSTSLVFGSGRALQRIELSGGAPRLICETDVERIRGTAWSRAGEILFGLRDGPLHKVAAAGGSPTAALHLASDGEVSQQYPVLLPDGKRVLYVSTRVDSGLSGVYLSNLDGESPARRVHPTVLPFKYVDPGYLLVQKDDLLNPANYYDTF